MKPKRLGPFRFSNTPRYNQSAMTGQPSGLQSKLRKLSQAERLRRIMQGLPKTEAFLVGGAVRDLLLKRRLGDLDFVVRGVPLTKLQRVLAKAGEVNLVGKTFGVLKFKARGWKNDVDVALPRTEHALGTGGTRDVKVQSDPQLPLAQDLGRRDFTVNALAVNLTSGELVDPTNGLADLAAEKLRAVGTPAERFQEDYSRMLRGLRFAVELGFEFETRTWRALKLLMPHVGSAVVPKELVAREFLKAFAADPVKTVDLWEITGAFRATMPEVLLMKGCPQPPQFHREGDVWTHARLALEMALSEKFRRVFDRRPSLETQVAIFLHDLGKPVTKRTPEEHGVDRLRFNGHDVAGAKLARTILERLRFSSYDGKVKPENVAWFIENHLIALAAKEMRPSTIERYFVTDRKRGQELLKLIWCDSVATISSSGQPALSAFRTLFKRVRQLTKPAKPIKPLVRGGDLIKALGIEPGPKVGTLLTVIRDAQLSKKVRTKEQALALAKRLVAKNTSV